MDTEGRGGLPRGTVATENSPLSGPQCCFHAQQCVEKCLKAVLEKQGETVRKIHALPVLLDQCVRSNPSLAFLRPDMVRLSVYAVEFRYPGESATPEDAKASVIIMKTARKMLRRLFGFREKTP